MTPQQRELTRELQARAAALRESSEEGLSIKDAVALAAVQLGLDFFEAEAGA